MPIWKYHGLFLSNVLYRILLWGMFQDATQYLDCRQTMRCEPPARNHIYSAHLDLEHCRLILRGQGVSLPSMDSTSTHRLYMTGKTSESSCQLGGKFTSTASAGRTSSASPLGIYRVSQRLSAVFLQWPRNFSTISLLNWKPWTKGVLPGSWEGGCCRRRVIFCGSIFWG